MTLSLNGHQREVPDTDLADNGSATALCVCGHPRNRHDPISARYCDATASGELNRNCVCTAAPGVYPGRM